VRLGVVRSVKQTDGHPNADPAQQLSLEAVSAQAMLFLEQAPVGETTGAKLSRLLDGFLDREVLPQAHRAAGYGIDPTPLLTSSPTSCACTPMPSGLPTPPTNPPPPAGPSHQSSVT
jgi:hypothetical protein